MQLSELDWAYVQERAAYFTGRGWVFARLDQFLGGLPGVFLLLGEPGTGKTAVAAQLALAAAGRLTPAAAGAAPRQAVPVAAAYFCRAGRVDLLDVAQRLSDQLAEAVPGFAQARQATLAREIHVGDVRVRTGDIAAGGSATGVRIDLSRLQAETAFVQAVTLPLKRTREAGESTQVVLLVDALDESLASQAAKELPRLLGDVDHVHLVVTARPDRRATGWLRDRAARVDLLADAPPGSDDVLEYLQRRLTPEGAPAAMAMLAQRIAGQAGGNFLYAFYVIEALRDAQVLAALDDAAARGVPLPEGGLTQVYDGFLRRELWRDDRAWSTRFGPVLAPLAVAQDEGLTTEQLKLVADGLGAERLTRTAIREVTRTARQFLDGPAPDGPFRVYHQSFADFLVDPEQNPDFLIDAAETHEAIVAAYAATDPLSWDSYARRNLALHASEAGRLDDLLEDARFLLAADPARLVPHLDAARAAPARATATVYLQTAYALTDLGPGERASQLELYARRLGFHDLAARIAASAPDRSWRSPWSHGGLMADQQIVSVHPSAISAVAVKALPDGTPVVVSGSIDGTVRVCRPADGAPVGKRPPVHPGGVGAVTVGALPDGTPVVVSGGGDGTVRVWRLADGASVGDPATGHTRAVSAVEAGTLPDGTPVVVSSSLDGTVRVWRLADGTPVTDPLTGHVGTVTVGALPDGTPVIVGGGYQHVVVWRLADGAKVWSTQAAREPYMHVISVATGTLPDGTSVMVSGTDEGSVMMWRLPDGVLIGYWEGAQTSFVELWAVRALPDGVLVVAGVTRDGTVGMWRLPDEAQIGIRTAAFTAITARAVGALPDGTPVIVGGSRYGTVGVWRLSDGTAAGTNQLTGHRTTVTEVAATALQDGTAVIVSGGREGTVGVWRLADGSPVTGPLIRHIGWVRAVTTGRLPDGTPVVVTGGSDWTVQAWRLADGTPVTNPLASDSASGSRIVTAEELPDGTWQTLVEGANGTRIMWRLTDRTSVTNTLGSHGGEVNAVATGTLPDGTPVVVSGGRDQTVRIWRLTGGTPVTDPLTGHIGPVNAVATGTLPDGTPVVVSGGRDRTVRIWRLTGGTPVTDPLTGHIGWVRAVATGTLPDGTPVVVSGGGDGTVRIWRLTDGTPVTDPLTGHIGLVNAVATGTLPDGTPVVVSGGGDRTVRIWRLTDGLQLANPLRIPAPVSSIAFHESAVIVASYRDIAVHEVALPPGHAIRSNRQ